MRQTGTDPDLALDRKFTAEGNSSGHGFQLPANGLKRNLTPCSTPSPPEFERVFTGRTEGVG
jgi:hypothetical protein